MRRLKILQLTAGLGVGGAERVVLDLARLLDPSLFEVAIASATEDRGALQVYGDPGVPLEAADIRSRNPFELLKLRRFVRAFAPDIIHAHMVPGYYVALILRALGERAKIVLTGHGTTFRPVGTAVLRATRRFRAADVIFVPDQHPRLNAARVAVIRNGVAVGDPPQRKPSKGVRFIVIGRVADQKDPLGLIRAFADAGIPSATLTFVGQGPLLEETQALATSLGLQDRISFLGLRTDVRELLREADIFLMHSKFEGLPIALLEAGAEALPIISNPVGAVPDLLADGRGYIVEKDEYPEMLRQVAANLADAAERGMRLYHMVKAEYSMEAFAARHAELYLSLASGHAPKGLQT